MNASDTIIWLCSASSPQWACRPGSRCLFELVLVVADGRTTRIVNDYLVKSNLDCI